MRQKPNRLFSRAAAMLLTVIIAFAGAQTAWAQTTETVSYIDADGTQKSVTATVLTGDITQSGFELNDFGKPLMPAGWYVVKNSNADGVDASCTKEIKATGDQGTIHIILADGAEMTVNGGGSYGFNLGNGYPLAIYGQSAGTGRLTVSSSSRAIYSSDDITINGGIVSATSSRYEAIYSSSVTINGGQVTATGGENKVGIHGTTTLGCRKLTDFIKSNGFNGSVTIKSGQTLYDGNTAYSGTFYAGHTMTLRPFSSDDLAVNDDNTEYTIKTATGWGLFCDMLAQSDKGVFSGKTVVLGNDIEVSRMAGSDSHDFCGTFDGQGNTLTFTATAADNYCAPFRNVKGGSDEDHAITISNLNVKTTITANDFRHAAGLIALQSGHVNVTGINADVTISSTVGESNPHDLYPAALVSQASSSDGGTLTVTGCTASGTISTDGKYAAGLVGIVQGTASISDCISSVTIDSSTSGDGTHGGIVAALSGVTNIYGTVFNGRLLGEDTESVGGFIGWRSKGANIYNSLFIPTEVTVKKANSATFARNDVDTHNCYYTYYLCDGEHYVPYYATDGITRRNGHATLAVTAGDNVTVEVSPVGSPTSSDGYNGVYSVSGITAYAKGITRTVGDVTTFYYGQGDQVSLTLTNTAAAPLGYRYTDYSFSGGATLADGVLTLGSSDVTVSVDTSHPRSTGEAVSVGYVLADGTEQTAQAVALDGTEDDLEAGNYFVGMPTVSFDHTLNLTNGDVMLILADGCSMNIGTSASRFEGRGFDSWYGHNTTLTICGQSLDEATAGNLNIYLNGSEIGIHVRKGYTQHSGNVTIDITGDSDRGIYALESTSAITINGGTLSVTADDYPAIWGEGTVNINGGKVDADGEIYGITAGGDITINGGIVNAKGSNYGIRTWSNGNIILGWTNATDRIYANGYNTENGTIAVASGKAFVTDDATPSVVSGTLAASAIDGKTLSPCLQLADNADNGATIGGFSGKAIAVQLQGRKLWKDGDWNTLCLPFSVALAGSPLEGADARQLTEASISGSTLNLTFSDAVTTIEAGRPYIIRWEKANDYADDDAHNIVSPVFSGVTVSSTMQPYDTDAASPAVTTDERVRFLGTYKSTTFDTEDKSILFLGARNTLYYPQPSGDNHPRIGAQRAYFKIGDDEAANARMLTAFNLNFGEGEQTGIHEITDPTPDPSPAWEGSGCAWYTLDGRKLSGKPTKSGVYVSGGRKVVVK